MSEQQNPEAEAPKKVEPVQHLCKNCIYAKVGPGSIALCKYAYPYKVVVESCKRRQTKAPRGSPRKARPPVGLPITVGEATELVDPPPTDEE